MLTLLRTLFHFGRLYGYYLEWHADACMLISAPGDKIKVGQGVEMIFLYAPQNNTNPYRD